MEEFKHRRNIKEVKSIILFAKMLPVIRMKKYLLIILTFSLFVSACNQKNEIEGLWYASYKQRENGKPEPLFEKLLLDIKDDSCYTIRIGDFATGDVNKIIRESHAYEKDGKKLYFDYRNFNAILDGDSLTLKQEGKIDTQEILNSIILRKLNPKIKNIQFSKENFKGSYKISGGKYVDSIDFINDSIIIFTGEYSLNQPVNKWKVFDYKGFRFFTIHDYNFPLTVLKCCSGDSIFVEYPFWEDFQLIFSPTKLENKKEDLIGDWAEIPNSTLKPPSPQGINEEERFYRISIMTDSVRIRYRGKDQKLKWELSNDGKRVYFMKRLFKEDASLKILELKDNNMTIWFGKGIFEEDNIIKLERKSNNR